MSHHALWTGVVCPQHSLQALTRMIPKTEKSTRPLAVYQPVRGKHVVLDLNRAARARGVFSGQRLADALAIAPDLHVMARNRAAEQRLCEQIALIGYRFSHQVAITGDGIVLEIGASRRLHGGMERLLETLNTQLRALHIVARLGTAPVPAAACMLARSGRSAHDAKTLERLLRDWPLKHLLLPSNWLETLEGLGLKRLGEVLTLPRFERERRLGRAFNRHVDQLLGHETTPMVYWKPPEQFRQRLELPVPTHRTEALLFAFNRLLEHLGVWLITRDRALTALHLELLPEDGGQSIELDAGLGQPGFRRERLLEILRLKLEPVRLRGDIEAISLDAESTAEHRPPQADLWNGVNTGDAWPALLDRLAARVGAENLRGVTPYPDHRPEKAWRWTKPGTTSTALECPPRPNWLLPEPRPCRVEDLRLLDGPERIETGWWDGHDCRRDYWTAHDRHGNRLWIFQEYKPRSGWFVHGLFG